MDQIELKILQASIALETTELKVKVSLEDVEKKHPGRKDVIDSMSETLNDLKTIRESFVFLREKYEVAELIHYQQTTEIQSLKSLNKKLKDEVINVKKNLTI